MYEFYRQSFIGKALQEVIEEMLGTHELNINQAKIILEKFDAAIPNVFDRSVQSTINFKGTVCNYNHLDGVWRFSTTDFSMNINNELIQSPFVKIVACDSDMNLESGRRRRKKTNK
ncbi:RNA polymerase II transcriptional preinitiation complex assembly [Binucleata daphniae]